VESGAAAVLGLAEASCGAPEDAGVADALEALGLA
jgi:hypothetical protein